MCILDKDPAGRILQCRYLRLEDLRAVKCVLKDSKLFENTSPDLHLSLTGDLGWQLSRQFGESRAGKLGRLLQPSHVCVRFSLGNKSRYLRARRRKLASVGPTFIASEQMEFDEEAWRIEYHFGCSSVLEALVCECEPLTATVHNAMTGSMEDSAVYCKSFRIFFSPEPPSTSSGVVHEELCNSKCARLMAREIESAVDWKARIEYVGAGCSVCASALGPADPHQPASSLLDAARPLRLAITDDLKRRVRENLGLYADQSAWTHNFTEREQAAPCRCCGEK